MKKRQRLVAVRVTTEPKTPGAPTIVPVDGESLEDLLTDWRIVQIQPLGGGEGPEHTALLLLEEAPSEGSLGRLGFGQP